MADCRVLPSHRQWDYCEHRFDLVINGETVLRRGEEIELTPHTFTGASGSQRWYI